MGAAMGRAADALGLKSLALLILLCFLFLFLIVGLGIGPTTQVMVSKIAQRGGAWDIVRSAINTASRMTSPLSSSPYDTRFYNPANMSPLPVPDPNYRLQELYDYFQRTHLPGNVPYNVECVGFVMATFHMAKHGLPAAPNAADFWSAYEAIEGWQRIENGKGAPLPGDIMVWFGGAEGWGHVAVIVAVNPPTNTDPGSVIVAQGNASGNMLTPDARVPWITTPGISLMSLPYATDTRISSTWRGYSIPGLIRNTSLLSGVGTGPAYMPEGMPNSPYVLVAWNAAIQYGISPTYFVKQIKQESGFNPDSVSYAGAVGIAQIMAETGRGWGLRIDDKVDERLDPLKALDTAAREMSEYYQNYLKSSRSPTEAYMKALVAYNAGGGTVSMATSMYGDQWFENIPHLPIGDPMQPYNYVKIIMEIE